MHKVYISTLNAPLAGGGAVMPTAHFEIVKFSETALYQRNIQGGSYD